MTGMSSMDERVSTRDVSNREVSNRETSNREGGPLRVFVYEYLSGGGLVEGDPVATAALIPLGRAMRDALVADLLAGGDCDLTVAGSPVAGPVPSTAREVRA